MTDIEIARAAKPRKILDIAKDLGLDTEHVEPFGHYKRRSTPPLCPTGPMESSSWSRPSTPRPRARERPPSPSALRTGSGAWAKRRFWRCASRRWARSSA